MNCPDCGRPCDGTKGLLIHRRKLHGPGRLALAALEALP